MDGIFGPLTQQAVITFQQEHGVVPADGIVGPLTKQALDNARDFVDTPQPGPPLVPLPATFSPSMAAVWATQNAGVIAPDEYKSDPCTSFASMALYAGGLPYDSTWYRPTDGVDRYINGGNLSKAWDIATAFKNYVTDNGWATIVPLNLNDPSSAGMAQAGDLIYYTWGNGGTHMAMVTSMNGSTALMTEQTGGSPPYSVNVQWNLAQTDGGQPILSRHPAAQAWLLHWRQAQS